MTQIIDKGGRNPITKKSSTKIISNAINDYLLSVKWSIYFKKWKIKVETEN